MRSASLNAARRRSEIAHLAGGEKVDLVVIGGGITGCGIALDAVSRGLTTVLVERGDLAAGTSSFSSKLIHGGLRYLRHLEFAVAWESARERHTLLTTTASHLVHAQPFVVPLNDACPPTLGLLSDTGIRVGDVLRRVAGSKAAQLARAHRISALEATALAPAIGREDLRGGILFWDGQLEDDARLVVGVARTAALYGARILTYCAAERVERGRVDVCDTRTSQNFTIRTRAVVNATGVWAGAVDPAVKLAPSKGVHVIVKSDALANLDAAIITPVAGESARWVGATPMPDGRIIVGVTDTPYSGSISDAPEVTTADERYLLETLNQALVQPLTSDDVVGRFAGLRPLLAGNGGTTADLSRHDRIIDNAQLGMTTIVGGKLTTYRAMAQKVVDHVLKQLRESPRRCRTAAIPLVGAADRRVLAQVRAPRQLVRRYGAEAPDVAALAAADASLLEPVADGVATLGVEFLFGVLHEGALCADDLLDRRTRLGLVPAERDAAEAAARRLVETQAA